MLTLLRGDSFGPIGSKKKYASCSNVGAAVTNIVMVATED
jgi:hypothetical protein